MSAIPTVVISLLLRLATSSCLPDAIPPEKRQNLVNLNGETYPVGFFMANYAASFAANVLGATLVEEVLGYHTTSNIDSPGSGAVASYYGIAGCRTPNDAADRGCLQGVTYYHVHMESWMGGYPADWNYIQENYKLMAPKDLGSMGYPGYTTMFIPKPVQQQAFSTQGLALEYYRNWNASWNQAWNFFGSISSISFSKLSPCNNSDTVMTDDGTMRRHVKFTADSDGVLINDDVYTAKCNDGFWWAPPSCRQNTSQCIPWITAGNGWGAEVFMQRFTLFNMPVAIGIAATWTDYTTVPLSGDMAFFWWAPDPTFLDLDPMVLKWPPHNRREFSEGLFTSDFSAGVISVIVSRDLQELAPAIESFMDNVDMAMSEMNSMLLDQKNTGDTWQNVTCRWITDNRALWETWLPDESKCQPGFGLFDSVLADFTNARVNAVNNIECQACPPGTFSQQLEDNKGITYVCVPCGKGTHQDSGASLSCKPCHAGEYQDENRSAECKRCAFGFYQDEDGQASCKRCPESTNTLGLGSISQSDCGCAAEYIDMNRTGGYDCTKCSAGMTCPALSQLVDMESGLLGAAGPRIRQGFFTTVDDPTEVFKCGSLASCPGGTPGTCAPGLSGTPCSRCAEGATWVGTACETCGGWREALWATAVLSIFFFLILAYYLTTSKVTAKATVLFTTTASFGMLVMSMQNLGLLGMMTVEWPSGLAALLSICQLLLLDIDSYGFSCVAGQSEVVRYLLSAMIFPIGVCWLFLVYAVSQLSPNKKYHWEIVKVCSTVGAFLQLGFSTMSATSLAPMMCYKHPNGLRSILKYPGVICGSPEHAAMLAIGSTLLVVFVLGFVAMCTWAVWNVPSWSKQEKNELVQAVRFLVFRFRLDSWWFGVPLLIRGPLLNLPVVLATDYPPIQVVVICMILTSVMVLQMLAWPWKVPMLNLTDSLISVSMVLVVTTSGLYIKEDDVMYTFATFVSMAMLSAIGASIFVMSLMTMGALFYRGALGGRKELTAFNLGNLADPADLAEKIQELAEDLQEIDKDLLSSQLALLAVFDTNKITSSLTLLATEVVPPSKKTRSFRFNRRIGSISFAPPSVPASVAVVTEGEDNKEGPPTEHSEPEKWKSQWV